jgi:pimeloyl-ACP methyl ester carboxylesterase
MPLSPIRQPIVVFGGFLSYPKVYSGMRDTLAEITRQRVWIVEARTYDWLRGRAPGRWAPLLRKLERAVQQAVRHSTTGKVTLIGHSAGGVVSRLYLSPTPFLGHAYRGLEYVSHLITLGSPHHSQGQRWKWQWIEEQYPGAYFAPQVKYTSIGGKVIRGHRHGSLRERGVYKVYERLCGDGNVWGDGLVPLASQLLSGAQQIVLDGVSHYLGFGGPWYGETEVIPRWWNVCMGDNALGNKDIAINQP